MILASDGIIPIWGQILIGTGALVVAVSTIWTKVLRPGARLISSTEETLPLLYELTEAFKGTPNAFKVLDQIVAQFRTDSGSSLRDVVNRLETAAVDNRRAGEDLKVGVEAAKLLAEQDRQQLQKLVILLDRLTIKEEIGASSRARMEATAERVAGDLAKAHERADAVTSGNSGDAADAAAQQSSTEKDRVQNNDQGGMKP